MNICVTLLQEPDGNKFPVCMQSSRGTWERFSVQADLMRKRDARLQPEQSSGLSALKSTLKNTFKDI